MRGSTIAALCLLVPLTALADDERPRPWPDEWPIVLAPTRGSLPPPPPLDPGAPATRAASRVLSELERVRASLRETRYQHHLSVDPRAGRYRWDCSLMTQWILQRAAPRSVVSTGGVARPLAEHFVRAIERAPTAGYRAGWQRIERLSDVRPGDVFAWRRPHGFPSRNTGHVGFVVSAPAPVPGLENGWAIRVADATRSLHQDDTRTWPGEGGFGIGVLAFLTDEQGRGTHYGWAGTYSEGYVVTPIVFGRLGP